MSIETDIEASIAEQIGKEWDARREGLLRGAPPCTVPRDESRSLPVAFTLLGTDASRRLLRFRPHCFPAAAARPRQRAREEGDDAYASEGGAFGRYVADDVASERPQQGADLSEGQMAISPDGDLSERQQGGVLLPWLDDTGLLYCKPPATTPANAPPVEGAVAGARASSAGVEAHSPRAPARAALGAADFVPAAPEPAASSHLLPWICIVRIHNQSLSVLGLDADEDAEHLGTR